MLTVVRWAASNDSSDTKSLNCFLISVGGFFVQYCLGLPDIYLRQTDVCMKFI